MTISELKHYANLYSQTEAGKWLNEIEWRKNHVVIVDGPGLGSRWLGGIILIDPESDSIQFGTYIHELRHEWQRKQQGAIKYALLNLTKKNEPDAEDAGITAQRWLGDEKCREMVQNRRGRE